MALTIIHPKVSAKSDTADTSLVRPSDWNAMHSVAGVLDIANGGTGSATGAGLGGGGGGGGDFVNVMDFGAVGDNTADDTSAIQAAIDFAYANRRSTIYVPAGNYKTTIPLFLDPPLNLRGNNAA